MRGGLEEREGWRLDLGRRGWEGSPMSPSGQQPFSRLD